MGIKPKDRIWCPVIRRSKLLFDSEKKAQNFIKFNAEDIKNSGGVAPVRSYFCEVCGGWHVTHRWRNTGKVDRNIKKFIDNHSEKAHHNPSRPVKEKPEEIRETAKKYFLENYRKFSCKKDFKEYLKNNPDNLKQLVLEWVRHLINEQLPEIFEMDIVIDPNSAEVNSLLNEIPEKILKDRELLSNYIKWEFEYKKQVNLSLIFSLRERLRKENKL